MMSALRLRARMLLALSSAGIALSPVACGPSVITGSSGASAGSGGGAGGGAGGSGGAPCAGPDSVSGIAANAQCFTLEQTSYFTHCEQGLGGGTPGHCPKITSCPALADINGIGPCTPAEDGPWVKGCQCCYQPGQVLPMCGRPFLVGGESVRAGVVAREDWQDTAPAPLPPEHLDPATRAALAHAWLEDARLEHASIASFARFSLHLLALGAPAELLESAQRAALDEVAHARACFALASRYAGELLGPGALPLDGALAGVSLEEAVAATVREGCVGETIASLLAAEQLAGAEDEAVREALAKIAEDEARHAELAFRFVAWATAAGGPSVRDAARRAFAAALAEEPRLEELADVDVAALRRHGRLPPAEAARVHHAALVEVIAPCARALARPEPKEAARAWA